MEKSKEHIASPYLPMEPIVPLQDPQKLDELIQAMRALHADLPLFQKTVNRAWKGTVSALAASFAAIVVGIGALVVGLTNRSNVASLDAVKTENVVTVCGAINDLILDIRDANADAVVVVARDPENLTELEQERLEQYISKLEAGLRLFDCSDEGLEELRQRYARND